MGTQTVRPEYFTWGPCEMWWGDDILGATKGGVKVTVTTDWEHIFVDKYGPSPMKAFDIGTNITVQCLLAESDRLENILAASPTGTESGRGITYGRKLDETTKAEAKRLILRAVRGDLPYLVIYRAIAIPEPVSLRFDNEDARLLDITFTGLIDRDKEDGERLFYISETGGFFCPGFFEDGFH